MSSQDSLMFDVPSQHKPHSAPSSKSLLHFAAKQHQQIVSPSMSTLHNRTDRFPLQDLSSFGSAATAYNSYRNPSEPSSDDGMSTSDWYTTSNMDCDIGDENGASLALYHHPSAKNSRPTSASRLGLTTSHSGHSVASSAVSESSYDDESELSRSLESAGHHFPSTPAKISYIEPHQRLPIFQPDTNAFQLACDARHDSSLECSPRSSAPLVSLSSSSSILFRDTPHQMTRLSVAGSPCLVSVPLPTSTTTAVRNMFRAGVNGNANVPLTASPLSAKINLPHIGEETSSEVMAPAISRSSSISSSDVGPSPHRLSLNGPSNLAARRKLPSLAISGAGAASPKKSSTSFMPHTPGGSVFVGARDGAATGDDSPVSPFMPPTPFVVARGDKERTTGFLSTPARTINKLSRKPCSAPDVHTVGLPSSPLCRQGSLGPLSPLSRDFAAVSVASQCSSSSSSSGGSSQDSVSTSMTSMTPPMSPLNANVSNKSPAGSPSRLLGVTRPKLSKSKSANRVTPYPHRESVSAESGLTSSTSSSSSPRKLQEVEIIDSTVRLSPSPSIPHGHSMKKSMSAPPLPEPKTVSAKALFTRTLHPVFASSYTLGDELGSGGFGFVVGAHRNFDGRPVAVKFIWKNKVPSHGWVRDPTMGVIPLEVFVLRVVDHPCVVKFIDLFDDDDFFYLVMEMHGTPWKAPESAEDGGDDAQVPAPSSASPQSPKIAVFAPGSAQPIDPASMDASVSLNGPGTSDNSGSSAPRKNCLAPPQRPAPMERRTSRDLFECIEQHTRFSEEVASWIFAQIVEAVYYLGQLGICHRDIKDENCVIDSDWNVKIIDFGSAVISDPRKPAPYFDRFFGTMTFASSEILQGRQYRAPHAEVWSLGVLLSILLSGECPFSEPAAALKGRVSSRVKNTWSTEAYDLLCGCVQVDPDRRATIAQVRDHVWVKRAWERKGLKRPDAPQIF